MCNEHVSNDWFNLENQIRAPSSMMLIPSWRVEKGSYSDYVKPFEADATGDHVPHVKTVRRQTNTLSR